MNVMSWVRSTDSHSVSILHTATEWLCMECSLTSTATLAIARESVNKVMELTPSTARVFEMPI